MLVLTRRDQEVVLLRLPDGYIAEVTVLEIDRGKVRLGFTFPSTVDVMRKELVAASGWSTLRRPAPRVDETAVK